MFLIDLVNSTQTLLQCKGYSVIRHFLLIGRGHKLVQGDAEEEEHLENDEQPEEEVLPPFHLNGI